MGDFKKKLAEDLVAQYIEKKFEPKIKNKEKSIEEVYNALEQRLPSKFYKDFMRFQLFAFSKYARLHIKVLGWIGGALLLLFIVFSFYDNFYEWCFAPPLKDEKMRVIAMDRDDMISFYSEDCNSDSIVGQIEFGTQIEVGDFGCDGKTGFYLSKLFSSDKRTMNTNFLAEECRYQLYMSIFSNLRIKDGYRTDPWYRDALLDYFVTHNYVGSNTNGELKNCIKFNRISNSGGVWDIIDANFTRGDTLFVGMHWGRFLDEEPFRNQVTGNSGSQARNTAFIIKNITTKERRLLISEVNPQSIPYTGKIEKVFKLPEKLEGFGMSRRSSENGDNSVLDTITFYNLNSTPNYAEYYYSKTEDCLMKIKPTSSIDFPDRIASFRE
ncbi:MAG: hypothetical protein P1U56_18510 [Saprospiraceae bacterium]|nr:hypothetical protein [Saprospiraceae bacterium]